jgi:hypothetical protein
MPPLFLSVQQPYASSGSVTHLVALVALVCHSMFIGGETTPPDSTTNTDIPMSNTNSIAALSAALEIITESLSTVKVAVEEIQKQQQVAVVESDELAPFHAWLQVELTPHFGQKGAKLISNQLNVSRQKGDYRFFIPVYKKLVNENLQKRQLLKTISAVYRYKFGTRYDRSALRSEIKYAKACPECGALAQVLVDRLISEGLWK